MMIIAAQKLLFLDRISRRQENYLNFDSFEVWLSENAIKIEIMP